MSSHTRVAATIVRHAIVVEIPVPRAFDVFNRDFGAFKRREHNMLGVDLAEIVFEPRVGGHVFDRGVDASEFRWARVLAFEPPDRIFISWDLNPRLADRDRPRPHERGRGALHRRDGWPLYLQLYAALASERR